MTDWLADVEPVFSLVYRIHPWDLRRMTARQIARYLDSIPEVPGG